MKNIEKEKFDLYLKLAKLGDTHASYVVGFLYTNGVGVKQDFKKAYSWLDKSAKLGDKDSIAYLGLHFDIDRRTLKGLYNL